MLFNSFEFLVFLPLVFILYWLIPIRKTHLQNLLLLISSYVFYSWWDYRFLFLLVFSTLLDYYTGIKIFESKRNFTRKLWLIISVSVNLGFLGFFKYYNFFIDSFSTAITSIGLQPNIWSLKIILPVGISFYTFHGLSYVFDIYNKKIHPTYNFTNYSLFVSFFPLLVAGPIERATHLLPQVIKSRTFSYLRAIDGLKQILWGLFKKIVIADNCAVIANTIFNNHENYSSGTLAIGAVLFAFQIYGDFSGYSDIALGTARLFGFELLKNFSYPYFSRDIAEFWRRWHISLSSWFRDYLYFPLGGSKGGKLIVIRNTFIIFLVSGFWHGANWTFIFWGLLNAIYFLPLLLTGRNRNNLEIVAKGKIFPSLIDFFNISLTFTLTVIAWIFFRSKDLSSAFSYVRNMITLKDITRLEIFPKQLILMVLIFLIIEWMGRERDYALAGLGIKWPRIAKWSFYYMLIFAVIYYSGREEQFIYFQF
jgi:alginate O-acetyltransferase complex protein AlgI